MLGGIAERPVVRIGRDEPDLASFVEDPLEGASFSIEIIIEDSMGVSILETDTHSQ